MGQLVAATARFEALEALQSHFGDLSPEQQANMRGMAKVGGSVLCCIAVESS
jgi:hypothetical protein